MGGWIGGWVGGWVSTTITTTTLGHYCCARHLPYGPFLQHDVCFPLLLCARDSGQEFSLRSGRFQRLRGKWIGWCLSCARQSPRWRRCFSPWVMYLSRGGKALAGRLATKRLWSLSEVLPFRDQSRARPPFCNGNETFCIAAGSVLTSTFMCNIGED